MPAKTAPTRSQRHGLRIRIQRNGAPIFLDDALEPAAAPPERISVPVEYATRQPWIEIRGQRPVVRPGGPASNPFAKVHTFIHADELVLRMADRDWHYTIVGQPDKYDAAGEPTDSAGDPTCEVRWFYDADLVED